MTKRFSAFLLGAATIAWFAGPAWAQAIPAPSQSSTPALAGNVAPDVQAIQQAADPSAAIAALANVAATDRASGLAQAAFVSKMVDFGMPELAFHQAEAVVKADPGNGTAWAVLAYVSARQSKMPDALSDIVQAGQRTPGDAFVQRTAGELLAWYELNFTKVTIPSDSKVSLDALRKRFADQKPFVEAYQQAKDALTNQAAAPAPQQPAPPPAEQPTGYAPDSGQYEYPPVTVVYPADNYYVSSNPWLTCEPAYYTDWWWQPYGFFWGPSFFPGSAFFDRDDFHHHRDFDHDNRGSALWHRGSGTGSHSGTAFARTGVTGVNNHTANVSSAVTGTQNAVTGNNTGQHVPSLWAGNHAVNSANTGTGAAPLFRSTGTANTWHPSNNVVNSAGRTSSTSSFHASAPSFTSPGRMFQTYQPSGGNVSHFNAGVVNTAPHFSGNVGHFSSGSSFHSSGGGGGGGHGGGHR
jgi:hypothetical protein